MQQHSETWSRIVANGDFRLETVAVIDGVEYSTITAPIITNGLLSDKSLSVGNCVSGTLEFSVMTNDPIAKSAQVVIKSRVTDETTYSEWLEFGTFWVDHRTVDESLDEKLTTLVCFDAMLKGNQPYVDNSQAMEWPKPMTTVVARIAEQMGVQVDSRTVIRTGTDYVVTKPNDDTTLLDILRWIGQLHGGNWTITQQNKLRLVPLVSAPSETFYVVDENQRRILTPEGDNLAWKPFENDVSEGVDYINVPVILGDVTTSDASSKQSVTGVSITVDSETTYAAGTDAGIVLAFENPYATQNICDNLFAQVNGTTYAAFEVTKAVYDPTVELGDLMYAGSLVQGVIYNTVQRYDIMYQADVSAPGEEELDSEYPVVTPMQKMQYAVSELKSDNVVIHSEIRQTQSSITAEVTRATGVESDLSSRLVVAEGQIQTKVTSGQVVSIIDQKADSIRLKADKIAWESTYSSMTDDGMLTVSNAVIKSGAALSGVIKKSGARNGLVIGGAQISAIRNGSSAFSITMPYVGTDVPIVSSYTDNAGGVVVGNVDPIVPEVEVDYDPDAVQPSISSSVTLSTGQYSGYGLALATNETVRFAVGSTGDVWINPSKTNGHLYVNDLPTVNNQSIDCGSKTLVVRHGLIMGSTQNNTFNGHIRMIEYLDYDIGVDGEVYNLVAYDRTYNVINGIIVSEV